MGCLAVRQKFSAYEGSPNHERDQARPNDRAELARCGLAGWLGFLPAPALPITFPGQPSIEKEEQH